VVVASHDLNLVRQRCDRALWLESGRMQALGKAHEVADTYEAWMANNHGAP